MLKSGYRQQERKQIQDQTHKSATKTLWPVSFVTVKVQREGAYGGLAKDFQCLTFAFKNRISRHWKRDEGIGSAPLSASADL